MCEKFQLEDTNIYKAKNNVFFSVTVNKSVVDSGCPLTVTGSLWYSAFQDSLRSQGKDDEIRENSCDINFRFGLLGINNARRELSIPIILGKEITRIRAKVVNANIPLLIDKDVLKDWKSVLDFDKSVLHVQERY